LLAKDGDDDNALECAQDIEKLLVGGYANIESDFYSNDYTNKI
jgi:hypothetical protein